MTAAEHGQRPEHHLTVRGITEAFRAWLAPAPMLSLATCAHCATTQVLTRTLEAEAQRTLQCRRCGSDIAIATVERGARTTWIEPFDTSAKIFPTSRYRVSSTSPVDRSN